MAGLLPGTRPLSATYAPDLVDDRPVEDPERELGADAFNGMKSDVAYAARMTPLLRVHVLFGAPPSIDEAIGPEGVVVGDVTVTRHGDGDYTVDFSGVTGVTCKRARATTDYRATFLGIADCEIVSPTSIRVRTYDLLPASPGLEEFNFTLWVE